MHKICFKNNKPHVLQFKYFKQQLLYDNYAPHHSVNPYFYRQQ